MRETVALALRKSADFITHLPTLANNWLATVRESFPGAWQRNIEVDRQQVLTYGTVFACITLIAADIAKLWLNYVKEDENGICTPTDNPAYSPVLRKPNAYSTRVKFIEYWIISKLRQGNTYVLKERNHRGGANQGNVVALHVLDPTRVTVLVAPNGSVFYELAADDLAGLEESSIRVPASEIIHDICVPLFHPLIGVSPIFACGLAAMQGLKIQNNSANLFAKGSQLSGVLTAPNFISNEVAERVQKHWDAEYMGEANAGKVAVLGDGLKFEPMTMTAVDAQLIDQLKWTAENICSCFHVPGYMVGIGQAPPYTDIQSLNLQYTAQALQNPIENLETLLAEGLEMSAGNSVEFDLSALLRMDSKTQTDVLSARTGAGLMSLNEARAELNLKPVDGGETPWLQEQNWPLKLLAAREIPTRPPTPPDPVPAPAAESKSMTPQQMKALIVGRTVMAMQEMQDELMPQLEDAELADLIAEAVKAACRPLMARIHALERVGVATKGIDGQSAEHLAVVNDRIAAIEVKSAELPRHGKDGTPGRDGLGIADALMTKDGHLVLTLSDGTTKPIGRVVGENGRDGLNGKDGSSFTTGVGAPAVLGGQSGDVYVDAKTGDIYQWR